MSDPANDAYLGDGVYAHFDGLYIRLHTSDGITKSPPIALEPDVLNALNAFASRFWTLRDGKVIHK